MERKQKSLLQEALRNLDIAEKLLLDEGCLTCKERAEIGDSFHQSRQEIQRGILPPVLPETEE